MTDKERDDLEIFQKIMAISGDSYEGFLSDKDIDYFGYLILKDELRKTNEIIKEFEKIENYEGAQDLLENAKAIQKNIDEINSDYNF
tara:strand:+ start:2551 stop:2811 length:261 start_codon:yes stop_codon:yes gene_type:complete